MLCTDATRIAASAQTTGRIVVIGSGAIGLYVASELIKRDHEVVVIEAGEAHLGVFSSDSYTSIGRAHGGVRLGRSRTLGGTTNLWGGQLVEFQPVDFNGRDWLPGSQWPVSYEEIAPYYPHTYRNLGLEPKVLDDDEVWRGIKTARPQLGDEFEVFLTRWLKCPNFAAMFAQPIKSDDRLAVLTGHTAVGFRGDGSRVKTVRVLDKQGAGHWIEGRTFILAAGTIENSRLLLHAAGSTDWPCPWRDNPMLGRRFQDHLGGHIGRIIPVDKRALFKAFCNIVYAGNKFQPKIRLRNAVLERERTLNIQALFSFESSASEHLVYLKQFLRAAVFSRKLTGVGDLFRNAFGGVRYLVPLMWRYVWDHRIFVPSSSKVILGFQAEQVSRPESRITIDAGAVDSFGLPRAVVDWRFDEQELQSIHDFALRIQKAILAAGLGELEIDDDLLRKDSRYLAKLGDTYHQAGGTIMGTTDQDGVVDRNLRVFGTENLYIGGAGTFPTVSNANTTFTALAFATRLADHLTEQPSDE